MTTTKEQIQALQGMTLVTIQQKQNLHVLISEEGKMVFTKGRNMGIIQESVFFLHNDYAGNGKFANAVIKSEIELLKQLYAITQVISFDEIENIETTLKSVLDTIDKISNTQDEQVKGLLYDEAKKLIDTTNLPNKDGLLEKLDKAKSNTVPEGNKNNPPSNDSQNSVKFLKIIVDKMNTLTKDEAEEMDNLFDSALEALEENPNDDEAKKLFDEAKKIHAKFYSVKPKAEVKKDKKK